MPKALKIRRHGLGVPSLRKIPFRSWLDEQPRSELKYPAKLNLPHERPNEKGWTTEDFVLEARARGLALKIMTVYKWCAGVIPCYMNMNSLKESFPTIRFQAE